MAKTQIAPDCGFSGTLTAEDRVEVQGRIEAVLHSKGTVVVCQGGILTGKVSASELQVSGHLRGEVDITDHLEVLAQGQLYCQLRKPPARLVLSEKAVVGNQDQEP